MLPLAMSTIIVGSSKTIRHGYLHRVKKNHSQKQTSTLAYKRARRRQVGNLLMTNPSLQNQTPQIFENGSGSLIYFILSGIILPLPYSTMVI